MAPQQSRDSDVATAFVHNWVRLYTVGMSEARQERRREQVASDIWEQREDQLAAGQPRAAINLEVIGRCLRGIPSDVLWRFQVEGLSMNLHLSVNRVVGATLIAMMLCLIIGSSIQGYDGSREGFEGELERAASVPGGWNVFVFTLAGFGILAAAAAVLIAFGDRSRKLSLLCGVGLTAAGVLVLVSAALYGAFADLADEFMSAAEGEKGALLVNARTVVLVLDGTTGASMLLGVASTWGVAAMVTRLGLVPKWMNVFVGFSVIGVALLFASMVSGQDGLAWPGFGFAILGTALWLVFAGGWLLLGGGSRTDSESAPTTKMGGGGSLHSSIIVTISMFVVGAVLLFAMVGVGARPAFGVLGLGLLVVGITPLLFFARQRVKHGPLA